MIEIVDLGDIQHAESKIPRHARTGAPKIFPETEYGKKDPKGTFYTRTTTYIDVLEDKSNVWKWKQRHLARGLLRRPDLLAEFDELADPINADRPAAMKIIETAEAASNVEEKADAGTVVHGMTHKLDTGRDVGFIHPDFEPVVDLYVMTMAQFIDSGQLRWIDVELFGVEDLFKVAGTMDRLAQVFGKLASDLGVPEGSVTIWDLKTGRVDYGLGKMAMQLALYSHFQKYCPDTYRRSPLASGREVNQDVGVIIHLPVMQPGTTDQIIETPELTLLPLNLQQGWADVRLASEVRQSRNFWNRKANREPAPVFTTCVS